MNTRLEAPTASTAQRRLWRGAVVLLATVAGVGLTARLGLWQLDRAQQKSDLQQATDDRSRWPALNLTQLPSTEQEARAVHHQPVILRGTWVGQATVFLENRQMNARPGFYVVTPLLLEQTLGAAAPRAVLVQRGWVPRDANERTRVPALPVPTGVIEIKGLMAPPPSRLFEFEAAESGVIRQNLDLTRFSAETGLPLQPYSVMQTEPAAAGQDGLLRQWPQPASGVQKHFGYAFQWFSLSVLLVGLYAWFQLIRPLMRARRDPTPHET